jgi:hypothetical protein
LLVLAPQSQVLTAESNSLVVKQFGKFAAEALVWAQPRLAGAAVLACAGA